MGEIEEDIRIFALENAIEHDGQGQMGPVLGKMMAMRPELRRDGKCYYMRR